MSNYPGYDDAIALGYTLYTHSGNGKSANYTKDKLCLTVDDKSHATLWASIGIVELEVNPLPFPTRTSTCLKRM